MVMKFKYNNAYFIIILWMSILFPSLLAAQTIGTHDWAKRGGAWAKIIPGMSGGGDNIKDMATDKYGNVYVLAQSGGKVNIDGHIAAPDSNANFSLASWDCNGTFRWMKIISGIAWANYLAVDTSEGIYIAGGYGDVLAADTAYFDTDTAIANAHIGLYIIKYDSSGVMQWFKTPVNVEAGTPQGAVSGLSAASNGDLYWYAYLPAGVYDYGTFSVMGGARYCAVKYNASGVFQSNTLLDISSTKLQGNTTDGYMQFTRNERSGRFYAAGTYYPTVFGTLTIGNASMTTTSPTAYWIYAAAFNAAGTNLWVKQADTNKNNNVASAVTDGDGNLYIAATGREGTVFNGDTLVNDPNYTIPYNTLPFAAAMDSAGNRLWFTGSQGNSVAINDIEYYNGFVTVAGYYDYSAVLVWDSLQLSSPAPGNGANIFLCKMNAATGKTMAIDSIKRNAQWPLLSADRNGNLFVGGFFYNQLEFGTTTLSKIDTVKSATDWFVAKYKNVNCNCNLLLPEFTATATSISTISFSYTGQTPYTFLSWNFGDGTTLTSNPSPSHTYTASGYYPVCVTVVNGCGSNTICHRVKVTLPNAVEELRQHSVNIYPNPAADVLYLNHIQPDIVVEVYNLQGQKLMRKSLNEGQDEMNIHMLPQGVYLLRFTDKSGRQTIKRIVKASQT